MFIELVPRVGQRPGMCCPPCALLFPRLTPTLDLRWSILTCVYYLFTIGAGSTYGSHVPKVEAGLIDIMAPTCLGCYQPLGQYRLIVQAGSG